MPRTYNFRITADGWEQLRRDIEALGPAGQAAVDKLKQAAPQLAAPFKAAQGEVDKLRTELEGLRGTVTAEDRALQQLAATEDRLYRAQQAGLTTATERVQIMDQLLAKTIAATEAERNYAAAVERSAQAAAAAQRAQQYQTGINANLGVRDDFGGAARAADIQAYGAELDRLRAKYVPLAAAQDAYRADLAELNLALRTGAVSQDQYGAALARTKAAFANQVVAINAAAVPMGSMAGSFGGIRMAAQQAGFQIADFAVQVQSGQGVLRAFVQQGSQMLAFFGAWGAAAGAAIAIIGGIATAYIAHADAAKIAEGANAAFAKALKESTSQQDLYEKAIDAANDVLLTQNELTELHEKKQLDDAKAMTAGTLQIQQDTLARLERLKAMRQELDAGPPQGVTFEEYQLAQSTTTLPGLEDIDKQIADADAKIAALQAKLDALNSGVTGADRDAAAESAKKLGDAYQGLTEELSPLVKAYDEYAEKQKIINDAVAAGTANQDTATVQLKLLDAAYKDALDPIGAMRRSLSDELAALKLSDEEREVQKRTLEEVNALQAAGVEVTDALKESIRSQVQAIQDQSDANDAATQAQKDLQRAQQEAAKEAQRAAEKQADALMEPWRNAIKGIQDSWADFLYNFNVDTIDSVTDVFNQIADIWKRTASELTAKIAMDFVLNNTDLGGLTKSGGSSGGAGSFGGTDFLSAFSTVNGATGSASGLGTGTGIGGFNNTSGGRTGPGGTATPQIGGGGYSYAGAGVAAAANLLPIGAAYASGQSVSGQQLGGAIGGAVGGIAGAYFGPVGSMIGSMVGQVGGSLLGGLFGNTQPPKQKSITDIGVSDGEFTVGGTFVKHDATAQSSRDPGKVAAGSLNDILAALGGSVLPSGAATADQILFYGRTPRYMSQVGGVVNQFGNDAAGAQDAVADFVTRSLKNAIAEGRITGLSEVAQKAIAAVPTGDTETLDRNVTFAAFYDSLSSVAKPATDSAKAVQAVEEQFKDMRKIAVELGVALEPIDEGLVKAKQQIAEGFNKTIGDAILAITDPMQLALNNQAELAQQRLDEAVDAGADLLQVERLNALERQKIVEQANAGVRDGLQQLLEQITFGDASGETALNNLSGVRAAFDAALAQANAGDGAAQGRLQDLGGQLVGQARGAYASGAGYFDIRDYVANAIRPFTAANDANPALQAANAAADAADSAATTASAVEALQQKLNDTLAQFTQASAQSSAAIADLTQRLAQRDATIADLTAQIQQLLATMPAVPRAGGGGIRN